LHVPWDDTEWPFFAFDGGLAPEEEEEEEALIVIGSSGRESVHGSDSSSAPLLWKRGKERGKRYEEEVEMV
jgi:hypothetical protein